MTKPLIISIAAALSLVATGTAAANGNYLYLQSDQGDWVGAGQTYWHTDADTTWLTSYGCGDGCAPWAATTLSAYLGNSTDWWDVRLAPLIGQPLVPGTYNNAQREALRDATHPGMDISGDGRGCGTITGNFTVYTASFTGQTVNQFRASFTQHCEGANPALYGEIGINVPIPPAPPIGTIAIDKGAAATSSTSGSLLVAGARISEVRYSTDGTLDTEPWQPYASSLPITLPAGDGVKTVLAQFKNSVGFLSDPVSDSIILDTKAPTGVRFTNPSSCCAAVATANPFRVTWTASDAGSGVANYTLAYTSAPYNGPFGASTPWVTTNSTHKDFTGTPGTQYCLTMQAKDKVGNISPPVKGCFVLPIDDASLSDPTASWTRSTGAPYYYLATYSTTSTDGATLVSPTLQAKRVGIIYTRCPGCGTLEVSFNGVVLGTVYTSAKSVTSTKQLAYFPRFDSVLQGTAQIRAGGGQPVYVDGLVFSRS
jgi:hypothetical protein